MPRILVADDNSNVHRTVALALKDAGVEVVAVGNGEAAVRKIAEIKPDLVLADIFMPVRSGYEVCEFVKNDTRFSSIPVVLLIGAFDPFDEREAQRVRADGILKKPFVPPDALLRMVAELLAQSATRTVPVPVVAGVAKADSAGIAGTSASAETESAGYTDEAPEEFAPANARLEWNTNEQPLAFGTLLETAPAEAEDSVVTAQRDPALGDPAFWTEKAAPEESLDETQTQEPQEEVREELEEPWRSGAGLDLSPNQPQGISDVAAPESLIAHQKSTFELPGLAAPINQFARPSSENLEDSAPQLPELPALELPPTDDWAPLPALGSLSAIPTSAAPASEEQQTQSEIDREPDLKDCAWATPSDPSGESRPESTPKSGEEVKEAAAPAFATLAPFLASLVSSASAPVTEPAEKFYFDPLPAFQSDSPIPSTAPEFAAHLDAAPVARMDPAAIEEVVQRVIERMQPKIIDLVTRELLRPVVEALVQRELEKK